MNQVKIIESQLEQVGRGSAPMFMLNFGKGNCLRVYRFHKKNYNLK